MPYLHNIHWIAYLTHLLTNVDSYIFYPNYDYFKAYVLIFTLFIYLETAQTFIILIPSFVKTLI